MSTSEVPPQQLSVHEINERHNITLGALETDRRSGLSSQVPPGISQNFAIQFELRNISRQVQRIAEKGKYLNQSAFNSNFTGYERPDFIKGQQSMNLTTSLNLKVNTGNLSKYNYYKQNYRFQSQKSQTNDEQLIEYKNEGENQQLKSFSPMSKHKVKRQELNVPQSESYYIYFDQPNKKSKQFDIKLKGIEHDKDMQKRFSSTVQSKPVEKYDRDQLERSLKFSRQVDYNEEARTPPLHAFSKQQPESKWVLEKKVKQLEKELNQMKKKQQQRERLKNFSYNPKRDEKVYVGRQVDQLIDSLWP